MKYLIIIFLFFAALSCDAQIDLALRIEREGEIVYCGVVPIKVEITKKVFTMISTKGSLNLKIIERKKTYSIGVDEHGNKYTLRSLVSSEDKDGRALVITPDNSYMYEFMIANRNICR